MTELVAAGRSRVRHAARLIPLLGGPRSVEAETFVSHLIQERVLPGLLASMSEGHRKAPRATSIEKMRRATGALLADLFDLWAEGEHGKAVPAGLHGASRGDFSVERLGFGYDIFVAVRDALAGAGLLQVTAGAPRWAPVFDRFTVRGGDATTYRLTQEAVDLASSFQVPASAWGTHWRRTSDRNLTAPTDVPRLVLRTKPGRVAGKKQDPVDLQVDPSDIRARSILSGIESLNGFLRDQSIGGLAFPGLRRIFSNGDQTDFEWNKGGRYYSLPGGHRYEAWGAEKRGESIKLNGEPVVEVDLRASHLTLLHALLREPFSSDADPYDIEDWPRAVVKAWVSQAIGASNPVPRQWSKTSEAEYEAERPGQFLGEAFPIRQVGADVKTRHPVLVDLRVCGFGALDLQYHEAEILRLAMEDLMLTQGIPVLPIHDALISPCSKVLETQRALVRAFSTQVERVTGRPSLVHPKVTLKS